MNQPNPATESTEPHLRDFLHDNPLPEENAEQPPYRHPLANQAIAVDMTKKPQAPQRPSSIGYVQLVDSWCYDDSPEGYMDWLEAQISAALEREKEKDAEISASHENGAMLGLSIRTDENSNVIGWSNTRAEQAEAELTRVKAERDRLRKVLAETLMIAKDGYGIDFVTARAALTPPPAKEKP